MSSSFTSLGGLLSVCRAIAKQFAMLEIRGDFLSFTAANDKT
jgi:hypothetical protein